MDANVFDIGDACFCQGDYYRALENYFPVLRTFEKTLGSNHPYTAAAYNRIGETYDKLDRSGEAIYFYDKALGIRERNLGRKHPDTAATYRGLAHVFAGIGYGYRLWNCKDNLEYLLSDMWCIFSFEDICSDNYKTAEKYYRQALDYYESTSSKDKSSIKEIKDALKVMWTKKEKENNEALDNYFQVMEIRKKLHGSDSVQVAQILYCIGLVYSNMDNHAKSLEYYQKSLSVFENQLGEEHYCSRYVKRQLKLK